MSDKDTAFQMSASNIRFGPGTTSEVGMDLADMSIEKAVVVIDPALVELPTGRTVIASLEDAGIGYEVFERVSVEPTDRSFQDASDFVARGNFDAIVAVGGGSTIDTAKAANLYATHPADFLEFVNAPIGRGRPVPRPRQPLIASPPRGATRRKKLTSSLTGVRR